MSHPPGLLERLSPRPAGCPLIHLGHNSSPACDQESHATSHSHNVEYVYDYHSQYMAMYNTNTPEKRKNHLSLENDYLHKGSSECDYLQTQIYQQHAYLNNGGDQNSNSGENLRHSTLVNSFQKQNSLDLSSLSFDQSYWEHENYNKQEMNPSNSSPEYFRSPTNQESESNYLLDNFAKLGKSSPSLDQGYHTLVSPSPGPITPSLWSEGNVYRGKKFQTKNNSFDRLPDKLVIRIFSFLPSLDLSVCARVCRRFEILSWTPSLWRTITLQGETISGDRAIRGVLRQLCGQGRTGACPSVERVHLTDGAKLTDRGLMLLARRCPELTHLQVQGSTTVSNNALFEIATRCHNLQHLDVTGCTQISCISVIPGPEPPRRLQLQYLDLTDCPALQDCGLRVIVRNCPQLAYLYLRRCVQITDAGLKFVPSFCSGLRELSVSDCSNITDFGLYELAKLGATLRYLSVAKCDQVSDAGLKVVAKRCYKLRYLNVRGCEAVSDDAITVLARSCTRLRALDIGKCDVSDAGLRALAESCPNLKKLSLRNCDLVTDRGVQCIAYYCRGLQQLNIQDCQISLEGYRAVKKYCKRCVIEHTNPGFF
ncbi:hypothetical protein PPYR_05342 [Photinus pyralis]|uniref:F-box domain-containing protein n=1 Tax=Photinus pyralis TaxID=7054 RepID=A0A1Y1NEG1_PHOPY|nr:F-box/LRR-repeat protein 7-like [Photinus pyralis]XP_031337014.1 F-box/LRR-repeat protein 7-like [Photinus pyralis]KAB0800988.1 hypothetical protein PPYR_05342 [Photinus pyralis]